jgi:hypothetical protein
MKKVLLVLLTVLLIFFESCSEDFNINAPHEDIYILNCVLQNDNSIQYAILSKNSYTENGGPPTTNNTDQYIKNQTIKIYYDTSVFTMRDTTVQLTIDGNITKVNCYYIKNLIIDPGKVVSIEASAPDGKILKSTIQVPDITFPKITFRFPPVYMSGYSLLYTYSWSWTVNNKPIRDIVNLSQLEVDYKKYEGGTFVDKKIFIPVGSIVGEDGSSRIINLEPSYDNSSSSTLDTINKKMREISENDPYKRNYIIKKIIFNVFSLDPVLSKFYSEYNASANDFTINLKPTEYSNITGGKGVFGTYYKFTKPVVADGDYIKSFGYQYEP